MPGSIGEHKCDNCGRVVYGGDLLTVCPYCMHALPRAEPGGAPAVPIAESRPAVPDLGSAPFMPSAPEVEESPDQQVDEPEFSGAAPNEPEDLAPAELPVFSDMPESQSESAPADQPFPPAWPPKPPPLPPSGQYVGPPTQTKKTKACGCSAAGCLLVFIALALLITLMTRARRESGATAVPSPVIEMQGTTQVGPVAPEVGGALSSLSHMAVLPDGRMCFAGSLRSELRVLRSDGSFDATYAMPDNVRSIYVTPTLDLLLLTPGMVYFLNAQLEPAQPISVPPATRAVASLGRGIVYALINDTVQGIAANGNVVVQQNTGLKRPRLGGIDEFGRILLHRAGEFELLDPQTGNVVEWRMPTGCALHNAFLRRDGTVVALGLRPPPEGGREPRVFCFDSRGTPIAETPLLGCEDTSPLAALDGDGRLHVMARLPQPGLQVFDHFGLPPMSDRPMGLIEEHL